MKRSLSLVLAVVLVLTMMLSFASCSGSSSMTNGYYAIVSVEMDGKDYPAGDPLTNLQKKAPELDNYYVKLMDNGEGEICIGGSVGPMTYDDKQITVNGTSYSYSFADGIITMKDVTILVDKAEAKVNIDLKYASDLNA